MATHLAVVTDVFAHLSEWFAAEHTELVARNICYILETDGLSRVGRYTYGVMP